MIRIDLLVGYKNLKEMLIINKFCFFPLQYKFLYKLYDWNRKIKHELLLKLINI